jgi:hypothetical protein
VIGLGKLLIGAGMASAEADARPIQSAVAI